MWTNGMETDGSEASAVSGLQKIILTEEHYKKL